MYYIASCSCGKDSLAMVLRLMEENRPLDEIVFYDTGMEFQAIYTIAEKLKSIAESKGIIFTTLYPPYDFLYKAFEKPVVERNGGASIMGTHGAEVVAVGVLPINFALWTSTLFPRVRGFMLA